MGATPAYIRIAGQIKAAWFNSAMSNRGAKLPTQEEMAERFGVSRSTIVRALSTLVAEGYIHSQQGSGVYVAAPSARTSELKCISLIVPNLHAAVIVAACRGVERRARQLGYQVLLASSEFGIAHERELVEQYLKAGVKGLVLYPVTRLASEVASDYLTCWKHETPVVTMDIGCETWPCSQVKFDNYRLGYDMTHLLLRHGYRRIAFMHIREDYLHNSVHDRRQGWMAAMREAGCDIPVSYQKWPVNVYDIGYTRNFTEVDHDAVAASLLGLSPRPEAVIAWNDPVAASLTQSLLNLGVVVPEEMRVTGFDNDPQITRLFQPLFPTSTPDFVRLGEMAVETLHSTLIGQINTPRTYYYPVPAAWREARTVAVARVLTERIEVPAEV